MKIFKKLKIIKNKTTGSSLKDQHKNHSLRHDQKMDFDIDLNINSKNLKELVFRISVAEKAFELNIKKLETDIKKCEDKIKEALIRDDEFEAKIWLQKKYILENALEKYLQIVPELEEPLFKLKEDLTRYGQLA
jgi:phage shock protein A